MFRFGGCGTQTRAASLNYCLSSGSYATRLQRIDRRRLQCEICEPRRLMATATAFDVVSRRFNGLCGRL